jgi:predicted ATPase
LQAAPFDPQGPPAAAPKETGPKRNFFASLFGREYSTTQAVPGIKGVYLYGGSGCGKSFLSEMFFASLDIREKQKQHFHEFMGGIHAELFELERSKRGYDPLVAVASRRARETRLLFLDEFQVTDVADASILRRLFECLWSHGLILLTTSNRHPSDLYKNGHQREFFLPFIDLLTTQCRIRE